MDKVTTETVSTNHNLFEEKGEPKRYRTEVLPLTSLAQKKKKKNTNCKGAPLYWLEFNTTPRITVLAGFSLTRPPV